MNTAKPMEIESETQRKINQLLSKIEKTTTEQKENEKIPEEDQSFDSESRLFLFRNYNPLDNNLSKLKNSNSIRFTKRLTDKILSEQIGNSFNFADNRANLRKIDVSLTPKKQNFDLKRDIQPYLSVLSQRTSKAIAELIDQKIKLEEQEDEDESESEEEDESEDEEIVNKKQQTKQKENSRESESDDEEMKEKTD